MMKSIVYFMEKHHRAMNIHPHPCSEAVYFHADEAWEAMSQSAAAWPSDMFDAHKDPPSCSC